MAISLQDYALNDLSKVIPGNPTITPPGAMQYPDGGQASMVPPVAPVITPVTQANTPRPTTPGTPAGQQYTPAATPVTTPTAPVTVGQALGFNAGTPDSYGDPTIEKYLRDKAYGVVDEKKIQRDQLKQFRQEIDATNKIYDQMVADERIRGEGRLGSGAAIAARGGILGSDFYGAQNEKILGLNRDQIGGIQAERQAKIANIMGTARKAAADEIAAKNLARKEGADAYLSYLSGSQERKKGNLTTLAKRLISQDVSPTDMNKKELEEVAKTYGVSTSDIIATYQDEKQTYDVSKAESELKTKKTEAEIKKIDADIASGKLIKIGEGDMLYDTETKATFKNPKTKTPGSGSDSDVKPGTYDEVSKVPSTIYVDIISNIKSNPDATLDDIANTYPELTYQAISDIYAENSPNAEDPGIFEKVGNWWDSL